MKLLKYYNRVKFDNTLNRPKMLTWDITNRCNLSCKHCLNCSGDSLIHDFSNELNRTYQISLAHQIAELKPDQCCLCGGETLLNPNIFDIIKIISSNGVMVNMVTNGLLITDDIAKKLKFSGISNVQVSIDGLGYQHDIFRNKIGSFNRSIEAIEILKSNKINVMISCCPNKLNFGNIDTYIEYMHTVLNINNIRMMPLLPLGRAKKECNNLFLNNWENFELVQNLIRLREKYPELNLEWGDPLEHLFLVLFHKRKYPIVMSIASNGDLTLTPYIPIVLGNIKEMSLLDIWQGGYNKVWANQEILSIIKKVNSVYDLEQFKEKIYLERDTWINT